ncbi:methyltransferase domain-containing protein [Embleya sp. MST-111070]|uniref:methyltransferase domain-containing protein n=1 Tax=Embleya sp. MST-111070 TaxID=3398231 RepID=UPI003F739255
MHATTTWDPQQHLRRSGPRTRPFHDLLAHVPELPTSPARIVDLGCGSGGLTAVLAERWPDAHITGLDNSVEGLDEAAAHAGETAGGGHIDFVHADIGTWSPAERFDLVISNAAIQWVPNQPEHFAGWTRTLSPGGVFAFQVPDNAASPSHAVFRELCTSRRWRDRLGAVARHTFEVYDPAEYVDHLAALGFTVNAWETSYAHVLQGGDPFQGWINGTGMRPVLNALADDPEAVGEFLASYRARLGEAYPVRPYGTVFTFRRVFAVARKEAGA